MPGGGGGAPSFLPSCQASSQSGVGPHKAQWGCQVVVVNPCCSPKHFVHRPYLLPLVFNVSLLDRAPASGPGCLTDDHKDRDWLIFLTISIVMQASSVVPACVSLPGVSVKEETTKRSEMRRPGLHAADGWQEAVRL